MEESHKEIRTEFRQQQVKLTYYLVALCVTAIAFCINKTSGQSFSFHQIPIGLALISWTGSAYYGLHSLEINLSALWYNHGLFVVEEGKAKYGNSDEKIINAERDIRSTLKSLTTKFETSIKLQNRLLYFGFICYVIGHLLEMYLNTVCCN